MQVTALITDENQRFLDATARQHTANGVDRKRITRATQVYVECYRAMFELEPILKNDRRRGDRIIRRLCYDDQRIDFLALPLYGIQEPLRRSVCEIGKALPRIADAPGQD